MVAIFSSRIVSDTRLVIRGIRPATDILGAIITSTRLIKKVYMDIRYMDDLNWSFSTGVRSSCVWLGGQSDIIFFDIRPLA